MKWVIFGVLLFILIVLLCFYINTLKVIGLFNKHSVSVFGAKGSGKDMLFGNVIARRKNNAYVSNLNYKIKGKHHIPFSYDTININNRFVDFLDKKVNYYEYPFGDGADIYLSDCGTYFPSQYYNQLDKLCAEMPMFMALSRQVGDCYVHTNCQNYNRVWDKIREQSDRYVMCLGCVVLFGFVIQRVRVYERYESALEHITPFSWYTGKIILSNEERTICVQKHQEHINRYGKITDKILFYKNKSKYDTRYFREVLKNGKRTKKD